jgi:hypothetical protein
MALRSASATRVLAWAYLRRGYAGLFSFCHSDLYSLSPSACRILGFITSDAHLFSMGVLISSWQDVCSSTRFTLPPFVGCFVENIAQLGIYG